MKYKFNDDSCRWCGIGEETLNHIVNCGRSDSHIDAEAIICDLKISELKELATRVEEFLWKVDEWDKEQEREEEEEWNPWHLIPDKTKLLASIERLAVKGARHTIQFDLGGTMRWKTRKLTKNTFRIHQDSKFMYTHNFRKHGIIIIIMVFSYLI